MTHVIVVLLDNSTLIEYDAEEAPVTGDTIMTPERYEVLGRGWIIEENKVLSCKVVVRSLDS